jgi:SsrA-binding protein
MEILNRKARYDYFVEETLECGIELSGNEVKSIRKGSCNIKDSYAIVRSNELFVVNMFVKQYENASFDIVSETRSRKLLVHKKEIKKLDDFVNLDGYTLVPLKIYFLRGKVKLLLGVCKGKKNYDKRNVLKEKDMNRRIEKELKNRI